MQDRRLIRLTSLVSLLWLLLPATPAQAQQSAGDVMVNACLYPFRWIGKPSTSCVRDAGCGKGYSCDGGFCSYIEPRESFPKLDSPARSGVAAGGQRAPQELVAGSTEQECDADRRCRLDRLKRRNQARRYQGMLVEEERALAVQRSTARERVESQPRIAKPLSTELYVGYGVGASLGYTFQGRFRLEGLLTGQDRYAFGSTVVNGMETFFDGYVSTVNGGAAATYLFRTAWWTPYIGLGALYSGGTYSSYTYLDDGFDFNSSDLRLVMHIAEARLGFDAQLKLGLRMRLGVVGRQPIYTQAKYGPGNYDQGARTGINAWFKSDRRIGPEFSIGWAF